MQAIVADNDEAIFAADSAASLLHEFQAVFELRDAAVKFCAMV